MPCAVSLWHKRAGLSNIMIPTNQSTVSTDFFFADLLCGESKAVGKVLQSCSDVLLYCLHILNLLSTEEETIERTDKSTSLLIGLNVIDTLNTS